MDPNSNDQAQRLTIRVLPESGKRIRMYVLCALLAAALLVWLWPRGESGAPARIWGQAPAVPGAAQLPLSDRAVTSVKVLPKKQVQQLLGIPDTAPVGGTGVTVVDTAAEFTATADLPPSRGGYTVAAVIDTASGETALVRQEKPLPWFHLGGATEIGVGFGVSTLGGEVIATRIRQDIASIKEVTALAEVEILAGAIRPPEARAMIWAVGRPQWFNY